ncbi:alpha/beta hydrolase [Chitinophaga sp.]|uniref:alpha/beta hydrolase n=1 Tax=Chitinophaga sp. TaxID=1869181 RepID=UPI0031D96502
MRKKLMSVAVLVAACQYVMAQESLPLYPANQIPFAKENTEQPKITVFVPEKKKSNVAVIVCSGGAYGGRANDVEGIPACRKLNEAGITAFLLDYRVPNASRMSEKEIVPLTDVQAAIIYVRSHAKQYSIKPDKVGIMGFSAGGHLVTTVATHFHQTRLDNPGNFSLRPDFVVAVYPVVSFADSLTHLDSRRNLIGPDITPERVREYSNELQVADDTPPTFIVSAIDDDVVKVENSLYLEAALRQHHVPVKMFLYAKGGHGFGVNNKTAAAQWTEPCINWILSDKWKSDF